MAEGRRDDFYGDGRYNSSSSWGKGYQGRRNDRKSNRKKKKTGISLMSLDEKADLFYNHLQSQQRFELSLEDVRKIVQDKLLESEEHRDEWRRACESFHKQNNPRAQRVEEGHTRGHWDGDASSHGASHRAPLHSRSDEPSWRNPQTSSTQLNQYLGEIGFVPAGQQARVVHPTPPPILYPPGHVDQISSRGPSMSPPGDWAPPAENDRWPRVDQWQSGSQQTLQSDPSAMGPMSGSAPPTGSHLVQKPSIMTSGGCQTGSHHNQPPRRSLSPVGSTNSSVTQTGSHRIQILQRPSSPTASTTSNISSNSHTHTELPPPRKPVWSEQENIGTFFINKVYFDQDKTRYWEPDHVKKSHTKILSFEELAPLEELKTASIVTDADFQRPILDGYLEYFPNTVDLSYIANWNGNGKLVSKRCQKITACRHCYDSGYAMGENGEPCESCRKVLFVPHQYYRAGSQFLRVKLLLLRYTGHLRVVITSAPLTRYHWERVAHVGWYCDFPELAAQVEIPDRNHWTRQFHQDLKHLLEELNGPTSILHRINFQDLSSKVRLIRSTKGNFPWKLSKHRGYLEHEKLAWRTFADFRHQPRESICQVSKLGSADGLNMLSTLFNLETDFTKDTQLTHFQVLFPSSEYVADCEDKVASISPASVLQEAVYDDQNKMCNIKPYLHNLDNDVGILSAANVYTQYVDIPEGELECGAGRYGWLMIGSQSAGYGSWGGTKKTRQAGLWSFARHELGVGIYQEPGSLQYINLQNIKFHFDTPVKYRPEESPFITEPTAEPADEVEAPHAVLPLSFEEDTSQPHDSSQSSDRYVPGQLADPVHTFMGRLDRVVKDYAFLTALDRNSPLAKHIVDFPQNSETSLTGRSRKEAFMHGDSLGDLSIWDWPPLGTYMLFKGKAHGVSRQHLQNSGRFRVETLLKIMHSEQEALEYFGCKIEYNREKFRHMTYKSKVSSLALASLEEEDAFWKKQFTALPPTLVEQNIPTPEELEDPALAMMPLKLKPDMMWLENHYTALCGGCVPKYLIGPAHISLLIRGEVVNYTLTVSPLKWTLLSKSPNSWRGGPLERV